MSFSRYALYYLPPAESDWVRFATAWLGWDAETGTEVAHPCLDGLPIPVGAITETPRKYGLHATLKPPFRLAKGHGIRALTDAVAALARESAPVQLDSLALTQMGRFLALCPTSPQEALNRLAARCVSELDPYRAPPDQAELDRRRKGGLRPEHEANLQRWGYPFVMDAFRFHITLSGRLEAGVAAQVRAALETRLAPILPAPFTIDAIALTGEAEDGRFHLIQRFALGR